MNDRCYYRQRSKCENVGVYSKKNKSPCELDLVGIANCKIRPGHETDVDTGKCLTVLEDQLKIVRPDQWVCFGSAVSSCLTITIVMNNNWKISTHIQPASFQFMFHESSIPSQNKPFNGNIVPYQFCNPQNVLPVLKNIVMNHPDFKNAMIKYIHIAAATSSLYFYEKTTTPKYIKTNLNSNNTKTRKNMEKIQAEGYQQVKLTDSNKQRFFSSMFPGKISSQTKIFLELSLDINGVRGGYIFVLEDGTLKYRNHDTFVKPKGDNLLNQNGKRILNAKGKPLRNETPITIPATPIITRS